MKDKVALESENEKREVTLDDISDEDKLKLLDTLKDDENTNENAPFDKNNPSESDEKE